MISFLSAVYDIGMDIGVITVLLGQVLMRTCAMLSPNSDPTCAKLAAAVAAATGRGAACVYSGIYVF